MWDILFAGGDISFIHLNEMSHLVYRMSYLVCRMSILMYDVLFGE